MVRVLWVLLLVVVLCAAAVWGLQRRLVFFPETASPPPADDVIPGAQDVELTTRDGLRLGAWFVPATSADLGVTVLVLPGNGGNRAGRAPLATALAKRGLSVLLLDYRGYGGNPGSPSEEGLALDAAAARDYAVETRGMRPERLVYFGESLGCAVAVGLATQHAPAGMLLRSPFVDLAAAGRHHYPWLPVGALLRDEFPVARPLADLDVPVTVVYGDQDSIVPPQQSRQVADVARSTGQLVDLVAVPGADHNDPVLFDGEQVLSAVVDLAERVRG